MPISFILTPYVLLGAVYSVNPVGNPPIRPKKHILAPRPRRRRPNSLHSRLHDRRAGGQRIRSPARGRGGAVGVRLRRVHVLAEVEPRHVRGVVRPARHVRDARARVSASRGEDGLRPEWQGMVARVELAQEEGRVHYALDAGGGEEAAVDDLGGGEGGGRAPSCCGGPVRAAQIVGGADPEDLGEVRGYSGGGDPAAPVVGACGTLGAEGVVCPLCPGA